MSDNNTNSNGGTLTAPRIHNAIVEIMRAVGPVAKSQKNQGQGGYSYRGIDQIYNAVHPHFAEHGVYSTSTILDAKHIDGKNEKGKPYVHAILQMRFTFWAGDGSSVFTEVVGEGIDYGGDKASNKAMSIADKYAILQLLKIPTAMVDADGQSPTADEAAANGNGHAKPAEPRKSVEELMREAAAQAETDKADAKEPEFATDQQRLQIESLFNVLGVSGDNREAALKKRNASTSRDLTFAAAAELIAALEKKQAEVNKAKQAAKDKEPAPLCGPCTPDQDSSIKSKFTEWKQVDKDGFDKALAALSKKLKESGRAAIIEMSANDAARLYDAVQNKTLEGWLSRPLEPWTKPVTKEATSKFVQSLAEPLPATVLPPRDKTKAKDEIPF